MSYLDFEFVPLPDYEKKKSDRIDLETVEGPDLYVAMLALKDMSARKIPVQIEWLVKRKDGLMIANFDFIGNSSQERTTTRAIFEDNFLVDYRHKETSRIPQIASGYLCNLGEIVPDDISSIYVYAPKPTTI